MQEAWESIVLCITIEIKKTTQTQWKSNKYNMSSKYERCGLVCCVRPD